MKKLIDKYVGKIVSQGLAERESIALIGLDAEFTANRSLSDIDPELLKVFDRMNINALLYAEPAEPYRSILRYLAAHHNGCLVPTDCETRTFLHDIPVIPVLSAEAVVTALSHRKAAIVGDKGIISFGTVSPEQAFVSFSSVCFSTFVKFFTDVMYHLDDLAGRRADRNAELLEAYREISGKVPAPVLGCDAVPLSPPAEIDEIYRQMADTGKELVRQRLVDSYFGNISYIYGDTIYISQTGSSMDELEACIDAVPLDGSSSSGITASSELSAHISIFRRTGRRAIIHGHPKFTVIMSMSCRKQGCDMSTCYRSCRTERSVSGMPVVSGEIGTGPTGLVHTVPEAMTRGKAVLVFGHGIFSASGDNFSPAFDLLRSAEETCRKEYFKKIQALI
ncbi:MAG: rRNA adenine dimethylase [Nitrospirae bacterium]|nr:rRNA adenine dimethylase [Nitrospirota bacterium]